MRPPVTRATPVAPGIPGIPGIPAIDLQIEELVLRGFAPEDRYLLVAAMQHELARLLAEGGLPPTLAGAPAGQMAQLNGGAFEVAAGATAGEIGVQAAHAIYRGLGR